MGRGDDRAAWARHLGMTGGAVEPGKPAKRSRFLAQGVRDEHGAYFHSGGELARWRELQLLQLAGVITRLERQVRCDLHVIDPSGARVRIGCFTPDFRYLESGVEVYEDFKSPHTAAEEAYRLRKTIFEAEYGVTVRETIRAWGNTQPIKARKKPRP